MKSPGRAVIYGEMFIFSRKFLLIIVIYCPPSPLRMREEATTVWTSKDEMLRWDRERGVKQPFPDSHGVWDLYAEESAAGVAEFWEVIQVSVSARKSKAWWEARAEMKSAFFTADWQFLSLPATLVWDKDTSREYLMLLVEQPLDCGHDFLDERMLE